MSPDILTANTIPPTEAAHLAFGDEARESLIAGFEGLSPIDTREDQEKALSDLVAIGEALGEVLGPQLDCDMDWRAEEAQLLIGDLFTLDKDLDQTLRRTPYYETGIRSVLSGVIDGVNLATMATES
jgi:hypothetical protein